jgi:hypothetical protein
MTVRRIAAVVISLSFVVMYLFGCAGGGDSGQMVYTLTGTVTGGAAPVVALFDSTYWFVHDFFGEQDVVDQELNAEPEPYTPLKTAAVNGGSFSITIPDGAPDTLYLLAFDDTGPVDGKFSIGTENGYFAMKVFDTGTYAVLSLSYIEVMGQGEYAVYYFDGATNYYEGFSLVGTSGFDFTID